MLIYVYLFTLIVGAVLLGASILLGGHDDADVDGGDVDGEAEAELGEDVGGHGDVSGFLLSFLSLRFWTFFFAFFGLTGLVLDLFDLVGNDWATLGIALGMGLGTSVGATAVLRALSADTSGHVVESKDYVGKTARVIVPFEGGKVGKVRVDVKGSTVDLLATGLEEEEAFDGREEVLIVEMEGARARVARLGAKKSARRDD
ncbi:MAG TPA: hypothetical protein VIL20_31205 [Sandaracinaceae bacterium]